MSASKLEIVKIFVNLLKQCVKIVKNIHDNKEIKPKLDELKRKLQNAKGQKLPHYNI